MLSPYILKIEPVYQKVVYVGPIVLVCWVIDRGNRQVYFIGKEEIVNNGCHVWFRTVPLKCDIRKTLKLMEDNSPEMLRYIEVAHHCTCNETKRRAGGESNTTLKP
ncbi:hypothetical protein TNCV_3965941 [Trichonephila clavipes]|nr:hypothetical protein TNCV_3965941 [Trichonephila clavipes]